LIRNKHSVETMIRKLLWCRTLLLDVIIMERFSCRYDPLEVIQRAVYLIKTFDVLWPFLKVAGRLRSQSGFACVCGRTLISHIASWLVCIRGNKRATEDKQFHRCLRYGRINRLRTVDVVTYTRIYSSKLGYRPKSPSLH
jgi:hypothetical protein